MLWNELGVCVKVALSPQHICTVHFNYVCICYHSWFNLFL